MTENDTTKLARDLAEALEPEPEIPPSHNQRSFGGLWLFDSYARSVDQSGVEHVGADVPAPLDAEFAANVRRLMVAHDDIDNFESVEDIHGTEVGVYDADENCLCVAFDKCGHVATCLAAARALGLEGW